MKSSRKHITLFLILAIIVCSITVFYVNAIQPIGETDTIVIETENISIEQELQPVAASSCPTNYDLYYPDGRIYANVHFDHSHGGMQPHVHVYTWHQGPNGKWNCRKSCVEYNSELFPRP